MSGVVRGFMHVRGIPATLVLVLVAMTASVALATVSVGVSVEPGQPTRAVGAPEIFPAFLAMCLPLVCVPRFSGREAVGSLCSRVVHTIFSLGVGFLPSLAAVAWHLYVDARYTGIPPLLPLLGTPVVLGLLGVVALYAAGAVWSVLAPGALMVTIVLAQHLAPEAAFSQYFSTAKEWVIPWELCLVLLALATGLAWRRHSLPPGAI
ncbi:hypothetical protein [Corynebacterium oculi]|uniref:ABC-2 family transporter protein n=1 Tax=Corynebacterium oculi TaxID=1544416 RepID=A0A0Q0TX86_9CORY|nr:hypothetical protein [Corynebacterium oculi]KQB83596.1 hypothetical protein Cocul_01666 [Corynebacterium oculi]